MSVRPFRHEQGAATLLLVLGLVLLATLASAYSSRAVLTDLLASQGLARGAQARLAAQAALATAESALLQPETLSSDRNPFLLQESPCPSGFQGQQWQCSPLQLPSDPGQTSWRYTATLIRDVVSTPHVWQIHARATGLTRPGQASVRQSVFMPVMPAAPVSAPTAALILNGCASETPASSWQICPLSRSGQACSDTATGPAVYSHFVPDTDRNGGISADERKACLSWASTSLPGGGDLASAVTPTTLLPCNRAAWRSAFGDALPTQLQSWSAAQERHGLHALSQPRRSIYWIDSPADWTQSLGTPDAPVLLVFSSLACAQRCPRIASGVHIHGTVYLDAGCDDNKMRNWQAGWIEGQVVVEAGLPMVAGNSRLWARPYARSAYTLPWPDGIDSRRVQRIAGSRWEGTP